MNLGHYLFGSCRSKPTIIPSVRMFWLMDKTWRSLFRLFARNIIYDAVIGCSCSLDWQPGTLYAHPAKHVLSKHLFRVPVYLKYWLPGVTSESERRRRSVQDPSLRPHPYSPSPLPAPCPHPPLSPCPVPTLPTHPPLVPTLCPHPL